jgi:hypothetical protein
MIDVIRISTIEAYHVNGVQAGPSDKYAQVLVMEEDAFELAVLVRQIFIADRRTLGTV